MEDERRVGFHEREWSERASERPIWTELLRHVANSEFWAFRSAVVERLKGRPASEVGDLSARRGASLRRLLRRHGYSNHATHNNASRTSTTSSTLSTRSFDPKKMAAIPDNLLQLARELQLPDEYLLPPRARVIYEAKGLPPKGKVWADSKAKRGTSTKLVKLTDAVRQDVAQLCLRLGLRRHGTRADLIARVTRLLASDTSQASDDYEQFSPDEHALDELSDRGEGVEGVDEIDVTKTTAEDAIAELVGIQPLSNVRTLPLPLSLPTP